MVPSSHFQDSVACRTCSHDSQLLRHPAIDIVWQWSSLPCFRLLRPLAIAVCWGGGSLSFGWFLNLSLGRTYVRTFRTWTLDLTVFHSPSEFWLWHIPPMVVMVLSLCPCSLLCYSLFIVLAHLAVHGNVWNRAM